MPIKNTKILGNKKRRSYSNSNVNSFVCTKSNSPFKLVVNDVTAGWENVVMNGPSCLKAQHVMLLWLSCSRSTNVLASTVLRVSIEQVQANITMVSAQAFLTYHISSWHNFKKCGICSRNRRRKEKTNRDIIKISNKKKKKKWKAYILWIYLTRSRKHRGTTTNEITGGGGDA